MADPLEPLRTATAALESARAAWREQIMEAHWLGYSNRAIAQTAGISYESVRTLIRKETENA